MAEKAITKGAEREPGENTTCCIPRCLHVSAINRTPSLAVFMARKLAYFV
jgi:hypothetical protein